MIRHRKQVVVAISFLCWTTLFLDRIIPKEPADSHERATHVNSNRSADLQPAPLFQFWDKRGKEGYMDVRGNVMIEPRFDHVTPFHEGLAAVGNDDMWGYIDRTGRLVIPMQWKEAAAFSDGVAAVVDDFPTYSRADLDYSLHLKSCGYVDKSGKYVINPSPERRFEQCPAFSDGLAPICYSPVQKLFFPDTLAAGLCGFLDTSGQWSIKPRYPMTSQNMPPETFSEGLAPVGLRGRIDQTSGFWQGDFAYIDRTGKTVFELTDYQQAFSFREGLARVVRARSWLKDGLVNVETTIGFVDHTGRLLFKFKTDEVGDFFDGRALVRDPRTKRYGFIDKSGKWAIPPSYFSALPFSDGLASVCKSDSSECAYIDTRGQVILVEHGDSFHDGLALQYLFTRTINPKPDFRQIYGYMNKSGKYVWISPGGETHFDEKWWRENYVGPVRSGMPVGLE